MVLNDQLIGHEITELLQAWRLGNENGLERLTPQVYRELHRAAKGCMRAERVIQTLLNRKQRGKMQTLRELLGKPVPNENL